MENTKFSLALEEARRGADAQAAALASLRTHMASAVTTGGLCATFLGGVAGRFDFNAWTGSAIGAFVLLVVLAVRIAWPMSFRTSQEPSRLVQWVEADAATQEQQQRDLALHMGLQYDENETRLRSRQRLYCLALVALTVELAFLLIGLWGR